MIKCHYQLCKAIWIVQGEALALIDVCHIKWRVTGKQHIQAYFTPQSVKDVSCSILCTVVMANEDSNIWSDGVPRMAGYVQWVRVLCKNLLICLLFGRSLTNLQYDSSQQHWAGRISDGLFGTCVQNSPSWEDKKKHDGSKIRWERALDISWS